MADTAEKDVLALVLRGKNSMTWQTLPEGSSADTISREGYCGVYSVSFVAGVCELQRKELLHDTSRVA